MAYSGRIVTGPSITCSTAIHAPKHTVAPRRIRAAGACAMLGLPVVLGPLVVPPRRADQSASSSRSFSVGLPRRG